VLVAQARLFWVHEFCFLCTPGGKLVMLLSMDDGLVLRSKSLMENLRDDDGQCT
jgi:hypothetical protein